MNIEAYKRGRYVINPDFSDFDSIQKWIIDCDYQHYETEEYQLDKKSRKRNKLYTFYYKPIDSEVVMKVSEISKDYKFWRKVDLFLTSLYKDYNYKSYIGSLNLHNGGVNTIFPIAYWTMKKSWLHKKSYFLYKKIDSDVTVTHLCTALGTSNNLHKEEILNAITMRCIEIVKNIHAIGVRHGDPHGGNILTNLNPDYVETLCLDNLDDASFTLIDNDRCSLAAPLPSILKRFFDLKCLARFNVGSLSQTELLRSYLDKEYREYWISALNFWKRGGFNIKKQLDNCFNI